jgi:biopolymer transport protein ExbD
MAARALADDDEPITGINVTPLVDIVLVLLVILMVTASYVTSRSIPVELPRAATGETLPGILALTIDHAGRVFVEGELLEEPGLRARVRTARGRDPELRAVISADGRASHAQVVRVVDVLRQEQVTRFALDVDPLELAR